MVDLGGRQGTISLADAIQKQATTQKAQALGITPYIDPVEQLMNQLRDQLNGVTQQQYLTPLEQLTQQARTSVAAQYDPQIRALRGEMDLTKSRGERNKSEARGMYNALGQDIAAQLPAITNEMRQAKDEVNQRYAGTKAELQQTYDASANEQEAIMKQLGIQAAMPDASAEQATDESYFKNLASADQRQTQDALSQIAAGATQYNQQSANNARLAGNNAVQDIQTQLEDYLQQSGNQLAALTSGKESAIAAALSQLQGADQQRAEQMAQQAQNQIMQLANFQLAAQSKLGQQNQQQDLFKGTTGLTGASNFLAQKYPDQPTRASALSALLGQVLSDEDIKTGRQTITDPNTNMPTQVPITDALVMQKIRELAEGQSFDQMDINNVIDAYLASIGKLR